MKYLAGIDQSTQATKVILVNLDGEICGRSYISHKQIIMTNGWVSHDPNEIFENTKKAVIQAIERAKVDKRDVIALGISNQRETTVAWNRQSGETADHAIVWQCARASGITDLLEKQAAGERIRKATGIPLSPYFPAAKMRFLLENSKKAYEWAKEKTLCLGTIDSWLVYRMTEGRKFYTDWSNASRTQLLNLQSLEWDEDILEVFHVPRESLPRIVDSNALFGETTLDGYFSTPVPICGVLGDSHAALFGHGCTKKGMAKTTYGTGSSVMMNTGTTVVNSRTGLISSIAWGIDGQVNYVLEGNINYAGAVITWLQKELGLFNGSSDCESLARLANPADTTYLVPAFTGLGAPHWDNDARALICGVSRTTGVNELVRAGLESTAYQVDDILSAMLQESGALLSELHVDGGPTKNAFLMQFQSDLIDLPIRVSDTEEFSALGAILLADSGNHFLANSLAMREERTYTPQMCDADRIKKRAGWKEAIARTLTQKA